MCNDLCDSPDRGVLEDDPNLRDRYLLLVARREVIAAPKERADISYSELNDLLPEIRVVLHERIDQLTNVIDLFDLADNIYGVVSEARSRCVS